MIFQHLKNFPDGENKNYLWMFRALAAAQSRLFHFSV
jgi:hypothetical protein